MLSRISLRSSGLQERTHYKRLIIRELVFLVDLLALALVRTERAGDGGIARVRVRAAAAGARGDFFAGDCGRLADQAAAGAAHQIDVDVIVMIDVGARREHRGE